MKRRTLEELINKEDLRWPIIQGWIGKATKFAKVLFEREMAWLAGRDRRVEWQSRNFSLSSIDCSWADDCITSQSSRTNI